MQLSLSPFFKPISAVRLLVALGFCAAMAVLRPCPLLAEGSSEVVLNCDFEGNPNLDTWRNLGGKPPIHSKAWSIEEENGNHFLRGNTDAGIFGITAPLSKAIEIGEKIAAVEVRVRIRKTPRAVQLLGFGLTSRSQPEGRQGRAFEMTGGSDSGFKVRGYQYANDANGLIWCLEGLQRSYSEGTAFLAADGEGEWHEWRILFDRAKGMLSFFSSDTGNEPALIQKGVVLDGVTLRSLWLNGPGYTPPALRNANLPAFIDYDDLVVSYTLAEGKK